MLLEKYNFFNIYINFILCFSIFILISCVHMCVSEYLLGSVEPCKALRPPVTGACKSPEVGSRN